MSDETIYMDNNATGYPDPDVVEVVLGATRDLYGNPSSHHELGQQGARAIEAARSTLATLVDCNPRDVTFTSGATEANNLAIIGLWEQTRLTDPDRSRMLIGATEHPSVLEVSRHLQSRGASVSTLPVDHLGRVRLEELDAALDERTLLVSVMLANNETGVTAEIEDIVGMTHANGAWLHSDATQAIGRLPVSFNELGIDLLTLSGHKFHGPKGVGALIAGRKVPLSCIMHGGGQEQGLRSGTLNTPGIVGLGVAARNANSHLPDTEQISLLRERFIAGLVEAIPSVTLNGEGARRLCNTVNIRFSGADAEAVMAGMPRIACSSGSACSSAVPTPSPVLMAMGIDPVAASEAIRFSLSRFNSEDEVGQAVSIVAESVCYVRQLLGFEVA